MIRVFRGPGQKRISSLANSFRVNKKSPKGLVLIGSLIKTVMVNLSGVKQKKRTFSFRQELKLKTI